MKERTTEDARNFAEAVAKHRKWKLNSDTDLVDPILDGLAANFNSLGYYQCPCRDSWGSRDRDKDIICPCAYAQEDIGEFGQCFCGLYVSRAFLEEGREASGIPERRPEDLYP